MTDISNELIYDVLKQIQESLAEIKTTQLDHFRQLIRVREDINSLRGGPISLNSRTD